MSVLWLSYGLQLIPWSTCMRLKPSVPSVCVLEKSIFILFGHFQKIISAFSQFPVEYTGTQGI